GRGRPLLSRPPIQGSALVCARVYRQFSVLSRRGIVLHTFRTDSQAWGTVPNGPTKEAREASVPPVGRTVGPDAKRSEVVMGRNRWFQLVASVIAMLMIANLQYSWNLFTEPIRKSMGWKLSDIQWAFTLFVLFQTWTQPMQGWAIDRI